MQLLNLHHQSSLLRHDTKAWEVKKNPFTWALGLSPICYQLYQQADQIYQWG